MDRLFNKTIDEVELDKRIHEVNAARSKYPYYVGRSNK
jgi:hypothetical protein